MDKIVSKEVADSREQTEIWKKFEEASQTVNRFHSTGNDTQYTNTNVRIRPISGITHGGDADGRMSNISKGAIGEISQDDNDATFNENAKMDLERLRERVKERKDNLEEALRKKLAEELRKKNEK